jgi:hypothetical protein
MKNNKKIFFKNRVKCFYTQPENPEERIKDEEESSNFQENNETYEEDNQDMQNPEEQGDLS